MTLMAIVILLPMILILAISPRPVPLTDQSLLLARLRWFLAFLWATALIIFTSYLGGAVGLDASRWSTSRAIFNEMGSNLKTFLVVALDFAGFILSAWLSADLLRLRRRGRAKALRKSIRAGEYGVELMSAHLFDRRARSAPKYRRLHGSIEVWVNFLAAPEAILLFLFDCWLTIVAVASALGR
ncbi:hypothetical protein AX769_07790 [Frondihabitans sp. PAMC 28766]|nr:hypothetical protein AX769_07790 [Frondihabitans sp. PAMC 28766]